MQTTRNVFSTVRSEGALLPPDLLRRITEADPTVGGVAPGDYHLVGEKINEAINRSWTRLQAAWKVFRETAARLPESDLGTSATRERWLLPLFNELGYGRLQVSGGLETGDRSHPISHVWQRTPIHLVGFRVDLDKRAAGVAGAARISPHGLVQDFLNRSDEHLWGIVSNGHKLRVLRDSVSLVRQAYLEFDLETMMEAQAFSDFVLLWLVCHQSRVEAPDPAACWLEKWSREAAEHGTRALKRLRGGVQKAITALGQGYLSHSRNGALVQALRDGDLTAQNYYRQVLRVVYRMLFLLVAEDRDLLFLRTAGEEQRERYRRFYSIDRIRQLASKRRGTNHVDLWRGLWAAWHQMSDADGCEGLGLPPMTGFLWATDSIKDLAACDLPNAALLEAIRELAFTVDDGIRRPVDFEHMGSEELGSVYESLLELQPEVNTDSARFELKANDAERKDTGSHYTDRTMVRRILDFALVPKIEACLAAADPEQALLRLRLLDPTCGSGHILIAAAHRIARALASVRTGEIEPSPAHITQALRDVVSRCIYGVDYNPMAVELCKIALWLETLDPGKPLSFLDHHIRCGNSLVGVPLGTTVARNRAAVAARRRELEAEIATLKPLANALHDLEAAKEAGKRLKAAQRELKDCVYDSWADAIPDEAFRALPGDDKGVARKIAAQNRKARESRQMEIGFGNVTVSLPDSVVALLDSIGEGAERNAAEVTIRAKRYDAATHDLAYQHAVQLADVWTAAWFWPLRKETGPVPTQGTFQTLREQPGSLLDALASGIRAMATDRRFFHYELAFPEVFTTARGGFDLVIGNPPYLGGTKISGAYGVDILHFLKANHPAPTRGREDLAVFFLRRGFDLLREGGDLCFVTTNSIGEGDTRIAGMNPITREWGGTLVNAVRAEPWAGDAAVVVSVVHVHRGPFDRQRTLDGEVVDAIGPDLMPGNFPSDPLPLAEHPGIASEGSSVYGDGFFLTAEERDLLLQDDPANAAVIKACIGAREAMNHPDVAPNRWVIDFGERPIEEASAFRAPMSRVEALVKEEREKQKRDSLREFWWMYNEPRTSFYRAIQTKGLKTVIVMPKVSKIMLPVRVDAGMVYTDLLNVIAADSAGTLAILSSSFHWLWAARWCTTMKTDPRYTVGRCFQTFPFPSETSEAAAAGRNLERAQRTAMKARGIGMTGLYDLVNGSECCAPDIVDIRQRHEAVDVTVADAYDWSDLVADFGHGHHKTLRFGVRWTVMPTVQREIERRLLNLNFERAAAAGVDYAFLQAEDEELVDAP